MAYTTYIVINGADVEFMRVKDSIIEDYIDERVDDDGENFEEVMEALFSEWCQNEFAWNGCQSVWEVTNVSPLEYQKVF